MLHIPIKYDSYNLSQILLQKNRLNQLYTVTGTVSITLGLHFSQRPVVTSLYFPAHAGSIYIL